MKGRTDLFHHHIHTLLVSGNFIFSSFFVRFWRGFRERVGHGPSGTGQILALKYTQRVVMETWNLWFQARFYQKMHRSRFGSYLLCRFSTDFNKIWQDWPLRVRESSGETRIWKFQICCHGNLKCVLWRPIWPWRTDISQSNHRKIWIKWTHKFFDHPRMDHFWSVSMVTVKTEFWCADTLKMHFT